MSQLITISEEEFEHRSEKFWTVVQQESDARHVAWSLEEAVFHSPESAFAHLQKDPAEYARTLARLIGLVWVTGISPDDVVGEELSRLEGQEPSVAFQESCEKVAQSLLGANR